MTNPTIAPYGSWQSPVSSDLIVAQTIRLSSIKVLGDNLFWLEGRPAEGGRALVVQHNNKGEALDLTPPDFNVRTRVHEYGGDAYIADENSIYFCNFMDQKLYRQDFRTADASPVASPVAITTDNNARYANMVLDRGHNRIICVMEDHSQPTGEAVNSIAAIDLDDGTVTVLTSGYDFYSSPQLKPDGTQLAWFCWNHPNMPWDESEVWLADMDEEGSLSSEIKITGGDNESTGHPAWSPDGVLYFLSDRTGWWNIHRWINDQLEIVCQQDMEFGSPHWSFGEPDFAFRSASELICICSDRGECKLVKLALEPHQEQGHDSTGLEQIAIPYSSMSCLQVRDDYAWFLGASPTTAASIVKLNLQSGETTVIKQSNDFQLAAGYVSVPETIEFSTGNDLTSHAFYYAPRNMDFLAPDEDRPPLMVIIHGGPTGATSSSFSLAIQYWTSRGIAVMDINYGGSTGYGRAYRNRLYDSWGIVDVEDCVNGANYLVARGDVDSNRLIIRGGSAGGYTTLAALTFKDTFKAGASYYGVSDLEALARDTHKFESRYLDRLVGPYPEGLDIYKARSPVHHVEQLSCPVIFFQGLEDKVVPPNQAEMMVDALDEKQVPVAYVPFEGEQHGFRKADNIKRALDAELYFYSRIFNFKLADAVEPVEIRNL
jgi:dipeptidyl aminopeptidase/acylaminoacyl peptidase